MTVMSAGLKPLFALRLRVLSFSFAAVCLAAASLSADSADGKAPEAQPPYFRIDFLYDIPGDSSPLPKDWSYKGKWGTPSPSFYVVRDPETGKGVLKLEAKKASGSVLYNLTDKVDLRKTPIMRWRWKAVKLPPGADGRDSGKDDQSIGVYIGCGNITRKTVAYRWETLTPVGTDGTASYGAGMVSVKWHCLRNQSDPLGKWLVEERNLAEDFKKDFGEIPKDTAISIATNSQYTNSVSESYLDYVEFLPAPAPAPAQAAAVTAK